MDQLSWLVWVLGPWAAAGTPYRRILGKRKETHTFRRRAENQFATRRNAAGSRTILIIGPLYGQLLMENKNPAWNR